MPDLKQLTKDIINFRNKRDWKQFHNPKDCTLSLSLEASELLEHFQWKSKEEIENYIKTNKKEIGEEIRRQAEFLIVENEEVLLLQKILKLSLDNIDLFNWEEITKSQKEDILYSEFKLNLGVVTIILRHYSIEKGQENEVEPKNSFDDNTEKVDMDSRRDVYQVFIDNKLKGNIGERRRNLLRRELQKTIQLPKVTINVLPSINQYGEFDNIQDDKPELKKKRFRTHSLDFLDAEERTKLNEMIQRLSDLLEDREEEKPDDSDWWKQDE